MFWPLCLCCWYTFVYMRCIYIYINVNVTTAATAATATTASSLVDVLLCTLNISKSIWTFSRKRRTTLTTLLFSRSAHNAIETKWKHTDSFPIYENESQHRDKCVYNNFEAHSISRSLVCLSMYFETDSHTHTLYSNVYVVCVSNGELKKRRKKIEFH